MISGQSNAWAIDYDHAYNDEDLPADAQWVRTIGAMHVYNQSAIYPEATNTDWHVARGKAPDVRGGAQLVGNGMIGVLGLNIGMNLVASESVPIAIINGAGGGGAISFYQKTSTADLDVPYGRLQYRLEASGLKNKIKAFIWNQGEGNAEDSVLDYQTALGQLYKDFKTDYTFEKFYLIQTPPGCNSKNGHQNVREAQRQFAKTQEHVRIMTRHGFPSNPKLASGTYFLSDGCHYHAVGYEILGKWISNMAKYDFYGGTVDFEAPQVIGVTLESSTSLVIEFDKAITIQPELIIGKIKYDLKDYAFAINNKRTTAISNLVIDPKNPKRLRLNFSNQSIYKGDTLSYILADNYPESSIPYQGPWLTGVSTGVGALGFTEVVK